MENKIATADLYRHFLTMIAGVVFLKWWTTEMSALFLGSSILIAVITRMNEKYLPMNLLKEQKVYYP